MIPHYEPTLATAWPRPFSDHEWLFEPKWDGYRIILTSDGDRTVLRSRSGLDLTARYSELAVPFERPVVLDGEVVVFGEDGVPSFELLQRRSGSSAVYGEQPVSLVVFDLLHLGDESLIDSPIEGRQGALQQIALPDWFVPSPVTVADGDALWEAIVARGLEGIVAKRAGSRYRPGTRSPDWRKISNVNLARVVVGGFTPGEGGRSSTFGSLLVGLWDGDRLRCCGAVGTGFSDEALAAIKAALEDLERSESPFHPDAELPKGSRFIEPALVARVGYRDWTTAGRLRQPRFGGFTSDDVGEVTLAAERPGSNGP